MRRRTILAAALAAAVVYYASPAGAHYLRTGRSPFELWKSADTVALVRPAQRPAQFPAAGGDYRFFEVRANLAGASIPRLFAATFISHHRPKFTGDNSVLLYLKRVRPDTSLPGGTLWGVLNSGLETAQVMAGDTTRVMDVAVAVENALASKDPEAALTAGLPEWLRELPPAVSEMWAKAASADLVLKSESVPGVAAGLRALVFDKSLSDDLRVVVAGWLARAVEGQAPLMLESLRETDLEVRIGLAIIEQAADGKLATNYIAGLPRGRLDAYNGRRATTLLMGIDSPDAVALLLDFCDDQHQAVWSSALAALKRAAHASAASALKTVADTDARPEVADAALAAWLERQEPTHH